MTKEELVEKLKDLIGLDPESAHIEADELLIQYINDDEITKVYQSIRKWYA